MLNQFVESGDYTADCKVGREVADDVLAHMRSKDFPSLLGNVVRQMIEHKRYSGIEVGFCHRIAERAIIADK